MLNFLLGVSLALNLIFLIALIIFLRVRIGKKQWAEVVDDWDSFKDFMFGK